MTETPADTGGTETGAIGLVSLGGGFFGLWGIGEVLVTVNPEGLRSHSLLYSGPRSLAILACV